MVPRYFRPFGMEVFYIEEEKMEERKFSEQELVRREKLQELVDKGIDPFGQRFDVTAYSKEIKETYGDKTHEELEDMAVEVKVAGRIMTQRR